MDRTNFDYEKAVDNIIFVLMEAKKISRFNGNGENYFAYLQGIK